MLQRKKKCSCNASDHGCLPRPQVPGSEGVHELQSSASALHHALEESASLLSMFWRAALPSSSGPALPGKAVGGQRPVLALPPGYHSASSPPQILKVRSPVVN